MEKIKWSEKVNNEVLERIGENWTLLNNILGYKSLLDRAYFKKKLPFS